jgi:hypothetical protein
MRRTPYGLLRYKNDIANGIAGTAKEYIAKDGLRNNLLCQITL